jgi:drug/metabolite transporter (DMT)-like permease
VDIVLALLAALVFALGTVLLQKAGMAEPAGGSSAGLLLRLARRPVWLAGIACAGIGFVLQAVALSIGRLAVVQPVLVSSVVFALPLGAKLTGQRVHRIDVVAALMVTGALVAFLAIANPSGGRDDAPVHEWVITGVAIAAVVAPLTFIGMRLRPSAKAATLGTAAGILFALSAALTKSTVEQLDEGVLTVFEHWHVYALIVVGYVSMTLSQASLQTGALAAAVATQMSLDPVASLFLGTLAFEETIHDSTAAAVAALAAFAVMIAGIAFLALRRPG